MPFVCLEIPAELTRQTADTIRLGVKGAIHKHLATEGSKFNFVAVHEVSEQIAGVTIDLRPSRPHNKNKASLMRLAHYWSTARDLGKGYLCSLPRNCRRKSLLRGSPDNSVHAALRLALGCAQTSRNPSVANVA